MSYQVLVIDDSPLMRKLMVASLQSVGITHIVEAVDGVDAEERFSLGDFDLVLSDWNMPHKTGVEFVRGVRATDSDVKVIMVTSEVDRKDEAIQAGADAFVAKPFRIDELAHAVETQLRKLRKLNMLAMPVGATPSRRAS